MSSLCFLLGSVKSSIVYLYWHYFGQYAKLFWSVCQIILISVCQMFCHKFYKCKKLHVTGKIRALFQQDSVMLLLQNIGGLSKDKVEYHYFGWGKKLNINDWHEVSFRKLREECWKPERGDVTAGKLCQSLKKRKKLKHSRYDSPHHLGKSSTDGHRRLIIFLFCFARAQSRIFCAAVCCMVPHLCCLGWYSPVWVSPLVKCGHLWKMQCRFWSLSIILNRK